MEARIRACLQSDLERLLKISYTTFDETFRPMNRQDTMDTYLEKSFNKNKLQTELNNTNCQFYFIFHNEDLAGYLKINQAPSQTDINDPKSIELERIYIKKKFKGQGLGSQLIKYALQKAQDMKKEYLWLGVWEKNISAISFYKKMGFNEHGRHAFKMGHELQNDVILKKCIKLIIDQ